MKKYVLAFITHYVYLYLFGAIAFFLADLFVNLVGKIVSNLSFDFSTRPYFGMMIPPVFYGFYGIYKRWKEPSELESYLDAQEDNDKTKQYVAEQKKRAGTISEVQRNRTYESEK